MNTPTTDSSKGNILVVDDTPANLRLLVDILTENGYKVRPVPNGKLALSAARGFPPDLILLDIMMPEINGYEVCEKLKADKLTCDIPVIFISAINDVLDKVKAFGVGGVDYISKPFQVEEVLARVGTHLAMSYLQKSLQTKNEGLSTTLEQLKATQSQLIQSEKMALLGQLIAGIGHEINTPLGAIRASVDNIADFLNQALENLPKFLQQLSPERQQDFFALLHKSLQQDMGFSSKEKRQLKRALIRQLQSQNIANAETIADTLVDLGIYDEIEIFLPLLKDPDSQMILNTAYQLSTLKKSTKTISTATDRAAKIVFALKSYARYDATAEKVETNITDGIETILTLYHNQIKQGVDVIRNYANLPPVLCYPDELNQVWTNLIHNALQAMNNQGTLTIDTTRQDRRVLISIIDSGKGIPQEIQQKIFEPFFTTKPAGQGSGLGLDIVKKILKKHEGTIEVESVPGKTRFTVSLPISLNEDEG
jgi:signal transduction histidine kinase